MTQQCHNRDLEASCSTETIRDRPSLTIISQRDPRSVSVQSAASDIFQRATRAVHADTSRKTERFQSEVVRIHERRLLDWEARGIFPSSPAS